jgi:hypothetical protein
MSGELIASALDFDQATFKRRYQLDDQGGAIIEHRVYISQTVRNRFSANIASLDCCCQINVKRRE